MMFRNEGGYAVGDLQALAKKLAAPFKVSSFELLLATDARFDRYMTQREHCYSVELSLSLAKPSATKLSTSS